MSTNSGFAQTGDRVGDVVGGRVGDVVGDVVGYVVVGLDDGVFVATKVGDLVPHGVVWFTIRLNPAWPQCCPFTRMREAIVDAHCVVSMAYLTCKSVALTACTVVPVNDSDHQFSGSDPDRLVV